MSGQMTKEELRAAKAAKKDRKAASMDINSIMRTQFINAKKEHEDHEMKFHMCEDDCKKWYFMFRHRKDPGDKTGDVDPLDGGEYLFELTATSQFPNSPPNFQALSENGVYTPGVLPCIVGGTYHPEAYVMGLGMGGFAKNIVNGLICPEYLGAGLNLLKTSKAERAKIAKRTREQNLANYPELMTIFDELYAADDSTKPSTDVAVTEDLADKFETVALDD